MGSRMSKPSAAERDFLRHLKERMADGISAVSSRVRSPAISTTLDTLRASGSAGPASRPMTGSSFRSHTNCTPISIGWGHRPGSHENL